MTASTRLRRLVAGAAASGLLAGGAALGLSGTAAAAPAPASVATDVVTVDHHDRCEWKKGHWEKTWVKGHWEKKAFPHKTWHPGHHDGHGKWVKGYWSHDHSYKWVYVPGHWDHTWVKGRTAVVIAHRLSTVEVADRVL
ncbi:hypothetical protein, partial [Streptomyces sp. NPDC006324]|uniref:hypothetical protein n=1 Tax=Streptomyces sp. NPDC006324 TaxID=3156751 RepID=UPI0033B0BCE1